MEYGFAKDERSSFKYWFAHWCAFNMTALCLHVWKPKYLLHDIEKPWLKLLWGDYKRLQQWHRMHNRHHMEYHINNGFKDIDWEAMVIDNECSRFTKSQSQMTARQWYEYVKESGRYNAEEIEEMTKNYAPILDKWGL